MAARAASGFVGRGALASARIFLGGRADGGWILGAQGRPREPKEAVAEFGEPLPGREEPLLVSPSLHAQLAGQSAPSIRARPSASVVACRCSPAKMRAPARSTACAHDLDLEEARRIEQDELDLFEIETGRERGEQEGLGLHLEVLSQRGLRPVSAVPDAHRAALQGRLDLEAAVRVGGRLGEALAEPEDELDAGDRSTVAGAHQAAAQAVSGVGRLGQRRRLAVGWGGRHLALAGGERGGSG